MLPKVIDPCPIIDAIVELRFEPTVEADAVFGILYNIFKESYPKLLKLPILQLPEAFRQEKDLMYQPHYKMMNDRFAFQVGPRAITVSCLDKYVGWTDFYNEIKSCVTKIEGANLIGEYQRLGIRYINFFTINIFEKIQLQLNGADMKSDFSSLRTEKSVGKLKCILQVNNHVTIQRQTERITGSVIDIDIVALYNPELFKDVVSLIDDAHTQEKQTFFDLIGDFVLELNPKY